MDAALHQKGEIIRNPSKAHFGYTTNEDKKKLMEDKNAKNTNRATKSSIQALRDYITEKQLTPLDQTSNEDLLQLIENFYCDAHTKADERYNTGSFKSIRSNINRYFKEKRGVNIITDTAFVKANLMFKAVQVQAKKDGKGKRKS